MDVLNGGWEISYLNRPFFFAGDSYIVCKNSHDNAIRALGDIQIADIVMGNPSFISQRHVRIAAILR